ncbi:MAG: carbonic anhydrase/acetyltransferase [Clostridiaceae bacterium]
MIKIKIEASARVSGKVTSGKNTYIGQGSHVISINGNVELRDTTWLLENSVIIGTDEFPVKVGSKTVFGHKCVVIGAEIGNLCEIGNCTIFMPGSKVGDFCIFGEGTIIGSGQVIPERSVVVGRPGKVIRKLTEKDLDMIKRMRGNDITLNISELNSQIYEIERGIEMDKNIFEFNGKLPEISDKAIIYDTAEITGDVRIGEGSVIASGVRIIGNSHGPVIIGKNVRIMENSVLHLLPDNKLVLHDNVTIGPGCMIHGTEIGEGTVIEPGAIVCDYSKVGENVLVKAGTLIKQRQVVEANSIMEGFPSTAVWTNADTLPVPEWAIRLI